MLGQFPGNGLYLIFVQICIAGRITNLLFYSIILIWIATVLVHDGEQWGQVDLGKKTLISANEHIVMTQKDEYN